MNKKNIRKLMMAGVAVIVAAVCTITAMSGAVVSAFSGTVSRGNADNATINTTKDNTLSANAASDISQPNRAGVAEPFGRPATVKIPAAPNNEKHTLTVTNNGVEYKVGYTLRAQLIYPEEISGMDSDQALEYIANKCMTFYSLDGGLPDNLDIVLGRDYFARIDGTSQLNPEQLLGTYTLEIADNSDFTNSVTTRVTIGNGGNGSNDNPQPGPNPGHQESTQPHAGKPSGNVPHNGGNPTVDAATAFADGADAVINRDAHEQAGNVDRSSPSDNYAAAGKAGRGADDAGDRALTVAANAATAGAGAGSIWLLVLIISDIQLLLWYKKLKAAKLSKALHH